MSGHSKWNNIKGRKEKSDAQRGKIFTKLGRELLMAVKSGGPDPASNSKLRDVIAKCKSNNMPNDNIERSIKKASGEDSNITYEEITYEGYGPSGVALMINVTTDNRNRTAGEIRHILDKFKGNLGTTGCVSYLFNKKGVIIIEKESNTIGEEDLLILSLDLGAQDLETSDEFYEMTTNPEDFSKVREGLEKNNINILEADLEMVPTSTVKLNDESTKWMELIIEKLEELDDVADVYHNWEEE